MPIHRPHKTSERTKYNFVASRDCLCASCGVHVIEQCISHSQLREIYDFTMDWILDLVICYMLNNSYPVTAIPEEGCKNTSSNSAGSKGSA